MRVALVSDIHSNDVAFEAVIDDAQREGADEFICLGDVATLGPSPAEVIRRLRTLGCLCIRGNHDDYLLDPELVDAHTNASVVQDAIDWSRQRLSPADIDFVRRFEDRAEVDLGNGTTLSVFHGSPSSNTVDLLATTPPDELDSHLGDGGAVMAGGHTHIQMVRQHRGRVLVNPGSVGLPFYEYVAATTPRLLAGVAEYAIVGCDVAGVTVTLRRVRVDPGRFCESVRATDNPLGPELLAAWDR